MEPFRYLCLFFAALLVSGPIPAQGELISVTLLFRHGERTPRTIKPKYGDSELYRELGPGELTLMGSKQCFENGVALRKIYSSLLDKPRLFQSKTLKIRSSSSKRCVQSATAFLAGFYPPSTINQILPIPWQTIPISVDTDGAFLTWDLKCPAYEREYVPQHNAFLSDPEVKQWMNEDREILDRWGKFMGFDIVTAEHVIEAVELMMTCPHLDPSTPYSILNSFNHMLRYVHKSVRTHLATESLQRLRGGSMITEITENMVLMNKNSTLGQKVIVYSAHDGTLITLGTILGVWPSQMPKWPEYSDTLAVEMHKDAGKEAEVRVYYHRNVLSPKSRLRMEMPTCGTPCTLSKFRQIMAPFLGTDMKVLCV